LDGDEFYQDSEEALDPLPGKMYIHPHTHITWATTGGGSRSLRVSKFPLKARAWVEKERVWRRVEEGQN
jgi:hypothetical protein